MNYKLGIDIGSLTAKVVVTDDSFRIKHRYYQRTYGQPVETLLSILKEIALSIPGPVFLAITGTGGKLISEVSSIPFVNEIIAQACATSFLYPQIRTIIEIGGENAKLIHLDKNGKVVDFSTNPICAAGTGSFFDQQASRLGISIEEFGARAVKSLLPPRIAGRCSVFAKTDIIHHQQIGTPVEDILAGLCYALASNFRSNVVKAAKLTTPVAFQGGVAANQGVFKALQDVLELSPEEFIIPAEFALMGALGAIYATNATVSYQQSISELIDKLQHYLKTRSVHIKTLAPLQEDNYPITVEPASINLESQKIEGYLGVDVGSISTNVVVIDRNNNVLARRYLMTSGRPIEAVKQGLYEVGKEIGEKVIIKAAGSTGSGRYLTGEFFGADVIKNEITSHAQGAVAIDPEVDTIFEIGGQDAKYISLRNGTVVDFAMNKVCAAGTGSFLEEQAEKLGIKLENEFAQQAFSASNPLDLGERCTVFMESQLNYYKQQGIEKPNLIAGLAYSIVANYLNKVVENRLIGERIFFQGGVAYNRAVKAAFEKILGKKLFVPPHHDILGAIGVAIIAREESTGPTKFKGFDLRNQPYESTLFECPDCPNRCEIRQVKLGDNRLLFSGSRCGKYDDTKLKTAKTSNLLPDLFKEREEKLLASWDKNLSHQVEKTHHKTKGIVGIPRIGMFWELFPLWQSFFQTLGFEVVTSDPTNRLIIKKGVENVLGEPCFPIKVSIGHIINCLAKEVDWLFLPSQITMFPLDPSFERSYTCPYTQALPYTAENAISFSQYPKTKLVRPVFHFHRGEKEIIRTFTKLAFQMGVKNGRLINQAIKVGLTALENFNNYLIQRGKEILERLKPDQPAAVILGRAYNTCDKGIALDVPERLRQLGILPIPLDFLPVEQLASEIAREYPNMYWKCGQRLLALARYIAGDDRLWGVYLTNFGCGPDSYIMKFVTKEMVGKPYLTLEIDEHASDVGITTRCEAFLDTIKNRMKLSQVKQSVLFSSFSTKPFVSQPDKRGKESKLTADILLISTSHNDRTLYIPYMDDHGFVLAAAMRACGIKAEPLPVSDEESLKLGRKFTSGRECFPSIITTGDILKKVFAPTFKPEKSAFFMPSAKGPCRFGQYNKLHRMVLDQIGAKDVPIVTFDQTEGYHQDIAMLGGQKFKKLAWGGIVLVDLMQKLARETRPYELTPGETDLVYQEMLSRLVADIEKKHNLTATASLIRSRFSQIKKDPQRRCPKIGIVGEIYVRNNPFTNDFLIKKLEKLGAEVSLPPMEEWFDYIDYVRKIDYLKAHKYWQYLMQLLTEFYQERLANKLRREFKDMLKHFPLEPPMEEVIAIGKKYLDEAIRGEAILSMARAREYIQKGFDGILNVIPFGCMPGTIVVSLLKQFRHDYLGIPVYTLVVDGFKDPAGEIKLEAFVQQCTDRVDN